MISNFAIAEIEKMQQDGLAPTPADIVRLNAIGLKISHDPSSMLYQTRRTARLGDVVLQEPTIGHKLYLTEISRMTDTEDLATMTIVRAWVASFDVDALPPVLSANALVRAVSEFMERHFRRITFTRLAMAVNFVYYGYSSDTLEFPVTAPIEDAGETGADEKTADEIAEDDAYSFEVGVIHEAEAIGLGISLADARRHTPSELLAIVSRAVEQRYSFGPHGPRPVLEHRRDKYTEQFYDTLNSIRERLTRERDEGKDV